MIVARSTARADVYPVTIAPDGPLLIAERYDEAIAMARSFARLRGVDAWYTGDQTHSLRVARYRPPLDSPS